MPVSYKNIQSSSIDLPKKLMSLVLATVMAFNLAVASSQMVNPPTFIDPTTISEEINDSTPGRPRGSQYSLVVGAARKTTSSPPISNIHLPTFDTSALKKDSSKQITLDDFRLGTLFDKEVSLQQKNKDNVFKITLDGKVEKG